MELDLFNFPVYLLALLVFMKAGGPADLQLASGSLSRRHALITVGDRKDDCTIEDLGSTNHSHILDDSGEPQTMSAGSVYPLAAQQNLVFGDGLFTIEPFLSDLTATFILLQISCYSIHLTTNDNKSQCKQPSSF